MDIVNEYHKAHRKDEILSLPSGRYVSRRPVPRMKCKDGFEISVQASEYSYCSPRETDDIAYYEFECGFPSEPVPTLAKWKDGDDETPDMKTVFGYVPVDVIVALIESHGGLADQPTVAPQEQK